MKKNLNEKIISFLSENNSIETRKFMAREFTKRGYNKNKAYDISKDLNLVKSCSDFEKLILIEAINKLSDEKIDSKKFFSLNIVNEFEKIKLMDEYYPHNLNPDDQNEIKKIEFINESYMNDNTKRTLWHIYKTNLLEYEKKNNKDLSEFNIIQIQDMIREMDTAITTKRNALSFMQHYNDWCVLEGFIEENNLKNINIKAMLEAPKLNTKVDYVSFEELYKNCMWMYNKNDSDIILMDVMIALIIRSGIKIKDLVNLKYSDVNYETGEVEFESDGKKIERHFRKFVIDVIEEVEDEVVLVGAAKRPLYKIGDHVVKTIDMEYDKEKMYKNIKKRMSKFKKHYRPINENLLMNSLKFDRLDLIMKESGEVTISDYKKIQVEYGNSPISYQKLREDYQMYLRQREDIN